MFFCVGVCGAVSDWIRALLPDAVRLGVRLITNMGAGELLSQDLNGFDLGCVNIALQSYVGAESRTGCVASVQRILWVLRKKSWSWLLNWASQSLLLWRLRSLTSIQVNFNVCCTRNIHQFALGQNAPDCPWFCPRMWVLQGNPFTLFMWPFPQGKITCFALPWNVKIYGWKSYVWTEKWCFRWKRGNFEMNYIDEKFAAVDEEWIKWMWNCIHDEWKRKNMDEILGNGCT